MKPLLDLKIICLQNEVPDRHIEIITHDNRFRHYPVKVVWN